MGRNIFNMIRTEGLQCYIPFFPEVMSCTWEFLWAVASLCVCEKYAQNRNILTQLLDPIS